MFKLSLPVQRFVIGCILLMFIIIGANALLNDFWNWMDLALDSILESQI